jgi:pSer/pThr/pTyr-binding forkhead associated (FHA) protein
MTQDKHSVGPQQTYLHGYSSDNQPIAERIISAQSESASLPALIGISRNALNQQFILDSNEIQIGREPKNQIWLSAPSVSSTHAKIIKTDNQWKLINLLSSNGTFVNGEKINEKIIKPGDIIKFANAEFVFTLVDDTSSYPINIDPDRGMKTILITAGIVFLVISIIIAIMIYLSMS